MAIQTYSDLQSSVADWLNRDDLTAVIPDFISMAELRLDRDVRLRQIGVRDFVAVEDYPLPNDFKAVSALYHDGSTYYGGLGIVTPAELASAKAMHGDTGVPLCAAVVTDSDPPTLRFAPEPSGTYTLRMTYERKIDKLSDENTSNTLLAEAPDIYLYAVLSEAEGYLQEDQRVALWEQKLAAALSDYRKNKDRQEFGGQLARRPLRAIGGDV
jgi:hypothetical protein